MAINCFAMGFSALTQNLIRAIVLLIFTSSNLSEVLTYYFITSMMLLIAASCYFVEKTNEFSIYYGKKSAAKLNIGLK